MGAPPFQPGRPGTGRKAGSRNRLSFAFIAALADDFEAHGIEVVRICRVERPDRYLQIVASLMPKELELIDNTSLQSVTDDELAHFIEYARHRLAERAQRAGDGAGEAADGAATKH
jgi:hypothetical protein